MSVVSIDPAPSAPTGTRRTWLGDALREHAGTLLGLQAQLGTGAPGVDAVHDARTASRRVRDLLRVYGDLLTLDDSQAEELDAGLRLLARELGRVRDVDVLRDVTERELGELSEELVMGPVREEVEEALAERRRTAEQRWHEHRTGDDHERLVDLLAALALDPPVRDLKPKKLRRAAGKRLERSLARAQRRRDDANDRASWHAARRATRRARYAAAALGSDVPSARKQAKRARRTQRELGRRQDFVLLSGFARDQAARYGAREGHNGFAYGLLRARADARS